MLKENKYTSGRNKELKPAKLGEQVLHTGLQKNGKNTINILTT
jgi:hypothetical protein